MGFSRETQPNRRMNIYIKLENQESQWCKFQFKSWQAQDPRRANVSVQVQRLERTTVPAQQSGKQSCQAFKRLDEAHPHWEGQSALLSLSIQKLMLPKNTLTDTQKSHFCLGTPWPSQVDITLTITGAKVQNHNSGQKSQFIWLTPKSQCQLGLMKDGTKSFTREEPMHFVRGGHLEEVASQYNSTWSMDFEKILIIKWHRKYPISLFVRSSTRKFVSHGIWVREKLSYSSPLADKWGSLRRKARVTHSLC